MAIGASVGDLRQAAEVGDEGVDGLGVRRLLEGVALGRGDDDVDRVAWSKASAEPGNSSACRSAAFSDGMPGMENASVIGLDMVAATVPTASIATSQPAMKNGHRR